MIKLTHNSKSQFIDSGVVFQKYKILFLTKDAAILQYLTGFPFPITITSNQSLDINILKDRLKLIWHAIGGMQIELAFFLICITHLKNTNLNHEEIILTRALAFHHLSLSYECLYRVWEKVTGVLYYLHYKKVKEKIYYNDLVSEIEKSNVYTKKIIIELKRHIVHWDKLAYIRNKYSHEESLLFFHDHELSTILNEYGLPFYIKEKSIDFKQECSSLINRYKHLMNLNKSLHNFMGELPISRIIIPRF